MLAIIHDDTYNAPIMQHITPNSKRGITETSLVVILEKNKGSTHMEDDSHYFRNKTPTPTYFDMKGKNSCGSGSGNNLKT